MTLGAAACAAIGAIIAADAFDRLRPVDVAQVRAVIAALVLGGLAYRRGLTSHGGRLLPLAGFGVALSAVSITFYLAIERLGVGPGTTIQFTAPVLVMLWMRFGQGRHVPRPAWIAATAALAGTLLMTRAWEGDIDAVGVAWAFAAAAFLAIYFLAGEWFGTKLRPLTVAAYGFGFSAIFWLVAVRPAWRTFDAQSWSALLAVGLIGTALPFLLQISGLRRADPGSVGVVATAEPVLAAMLGWLVLDQRLGAIQVVGGIVIVAAVAVVNAAIGQKAP